MGIYALSDSGEKVFLEVCQAGAHLLLASAFLSFQPMLFADMEHVVVLKER